MDSIIAAAREMQLSEVALNVLATARTPRSAVEALLDAELAADALGLLARLLPRRYAVAWLCQCVRADEPARSDDRAGVELAERWVREPDDTRRRDALAYAQAHRFRTVGAWVAAAAGWSGGNLAPPGSEIVAVPTEFMTARAAAAAITHLAARASTRFAQRRAGFVRVALDLLGPPERIDGGIR
ncbi:DUF6931 family protein [Paraburkholderia solisilvae]|uniref:Uncharacterized protein n=1 Tax=Paraburkholderia solisilvae TaxID=624376 RepID=A0A6J5EU19_9BURK|nr:hypothetical protein [Paraburkholderia solisilvae]CAB3770078.1 hypothetical protein LMG29739_05701 [Paraburkholderia solisilvae]